VKMRKLTRREAWLLACLPAAILAMLYRTTLAPQVAAAERLQGELDDARSTAPAPARSTSTWNPSAR